jgi:hypothetical protein
MGVFKDIHSLKKQARDMQANMPSAREQMANAQSRLAHVNEMLANQTQAANAAARAAAGLADGTALRRTVSINSMRQIGTVNFDLLIEFDLTVLADDRPPYPATTQQTISQMQIGQVRPGMTLQGAVDPSNPEAIWLDLTSL